MEDNGDAQDLATSVTITRAELNQLSHAFHNYQAMAEQVQSLVTEVAQLRLLSITPAATPDIRTPQPAARPVPKVLHPDPFTGDRLELDTYLTRCQHVFLTQASLFPTEESKVLYASSYLTDTAYSWVKPLIQEYAKGTSVPPEFTSFQKYSESLTRMYGDPDIVKSKTREINALCQTSSESAYASEFRRLQAYITWNDQALFDQFYEGLSENVKDGLVHENPRPTLLEDLISAALRIDVRIYERILERKSASARQGSTSRHRTVSRPTTSAPPPTLHQSVPPTQTNAHDASTPMELDQQRAPSLPRKNNAVWSLGSSITCASGAALPFITSQTAPRLRN